MATTQELVQYLEEVIKDNEEEQAVPNFKQILANNFVSFKLVVPGGEEARDQVIGLLAQFDIKNEGNIGKKVYFCTRKNNLLQLIKHLKKVK